jgi:oxygen-independent coproporphyrinogen-3 oxidase
VRFANPEEHSQYGAGGSPLVLIDISGREAFEETIFLGLRMNEGICRSQLRRNFPGEFVVPTEDAARELIRDGLMIERDDRWQLTLRGRLISNDVFTNLLLGVAV